MVTIAKTAYRSLQIVQAVAGRAERRPPIGADWWGRTSEEVGDVEAIIDLIEVSVATVRFLEGGHFFPKGATF
jgi:hypothetical protein